MAYIPKATILFFMVVVTCSEHIGNAKGSCQLSDIHISQVVTGKVVEGQPQFQAEVMVSCFGLPSIGTVDKTKIHVVDSELCGVANGGPIAKGSPMIFTYAKMTPQDFPVISAKPRC
ncbi:hypothetical protein GQ55_1G123700 [Panicum hallii var. hallii]|uniref:Uncharacterized protein n=1 Tax=Panicum hallii var. hallii TaxID=1504633 RepID=A0A2T7F4X4_9POAL|nr:hypothetical protein GQ55_1G123700 [Panicum hallii var. hallii]